MSPARRDLVILGSVAAGAAVAGGVLGALVRQSASGVTELLSATYPTPSGESQRFVEWRGQPLVCNFWATWCAPCREEIPLLGKAHAENASKSLQVVGIALDSAANVREYAKSVAIPYPVVVAGAGGIELMRRLGNASGGLPFTVMVDRQGRLRERRLGAYSALELQSEVARLLR